MNQPRRRELARALRCGIDELADLGERVVTPIRDVERTGFANTLETAEFVIERDIYVALARIARQQASADANAAVALRLDACEVKAARDPRTRPRLIAAAGQAVGTSPRSV